MMNFEEFKAWVKENITSKDWKETSQVEISVVKKNNGVSKAGLFIRESGQDVSPILYLDDYYIHYQNGELLENVIKKIRDDYNEKVQMAAVKIPNLQEFENVRGKIIYRLVNYEKNKELLEDCPHRRLHDLAVTFRWVAHIDDDGVSTSLITNRQVKEWGITVNDLVLAAQQNTPRLFPAKIIDMEEMLAGRRLLAVYEKAELDTYTKEELKSRIPNAVRYQNKYVQRPAATLIVLKNKIVPYLNKLKRRKNGLYIKYQKIFQEIFEKIDGREAKLTGKLSDSYILGYYHQKESFYQKQEEDAEKPEVIAI